MTRVSFAPQDDPRELRCSRRPAWASLLRMTSAARRSGWQLLLS